MKEKKGVTRLPDEDFYQGLSLAEVVEAIAEHHHAHETRHISEYEHAILLEAAEQLRVRQPA